MMTWSDMEHGKSKSQFWFPSTWRIMRLYPKKGSCGNQVLIQGVYQSPLFTNWDGEAGAHRRDTTARTTRRNGFTPAVTPPVLEEVPERMNEKHPQTIRLGCLASKRQLYTLKFF